MSAIRIVLVDRNKLFREGLRRLLDDGQFHFLSEANDVDATIELIEAGKIEQPELVVIDLTASDHETAEPVRRLRTILGPDARIVVLTGEVSTQALARALEAGADGYLLKDLSAEALAQSLRLVMMGEKVFPTHLAALLINGRVDFATPSLAIEATNLSDREIQILRCLLSGESNKMIARNLGITEATVKVHLKGLLKKINASNRTQAAIWALNNGLAPGGADPQQVQLADA